MFPYHNHAQVPLHVSFIQRKDERHLVSRYYGLLKRWRRNAALIIPKHCISWVPVPVDVVVVVPAVVVIVVKVLVDVLDLVVVVVSDTYVGNVTFSIAFWIQSKYGVSRMKVPASPDFLHCSR